MATQIRPQPALAPMVDSEEIANLRANVRVLHDRLVLLQRDMDKLVIREQRRLEAEKADLSHEHAASDVTSETFADARIAESNVTQHEAAINHDNLLGFVAAEHLDWSADQGATDINDANIAVTGVTQHEASINHDNLSGFVGNEHIDHTTVSIATAATSGLSGGGDISSTRNLTLDLTLLTAMTTPADADVVGMYDDGVGQRKITWANIKTALQSALAHDSFPDFVGNEHINHTSVSIATAATSGLSGGGDISSTRNIVLDLTQLTAMTTPADADVIGMYDDGVGQRKITFANLEAGIRHNNLSGYSIDQHRVINDAGSATTDLWSASKIGTDLDGKAPLMTVSTVTTATSAAVEHVYLVDASSAAVTVTLPAASGNSGARVTVKKIDATAYRVEVDPNSATIDGDSGNLVLADQWSAADLICDGSGWFIV